MHLLVLFLIMYHQCMVMNHIKFLIKIALFIFFYFASHSPSHVAFKDILQQFCMLFIFPSHCRPCFKCSLICEIIQVLEYQNKMIHRWVVCHELPSLRHSLRIVYGGCTCVSPLLSSYLVFIYDTCHDYLLFVTAGYVPDLVADNVWRSQLLVFCVEWMYFADVYISRPTRCTNSYNVSLFIIKCSTRLGLLVHHQEQRLELYIAIGISR